MILSGSRTALGLLVTWWPSRHFPIIWNSLAILLTSSNTFWKLPLSFFLNFYFTFDDFFFSTNARLSNWSLFLTLIDQPLHELVGGASSVCYIQPIPGCHHLVQEMYRWPPPYLALWRGSFIRFSELFEFCHETCIGSHSRPPMRCVMSWSVTHACSLLPLRLLHVGPSPFLLSSVHPRWSSAI